VDYFHDVVFVVGELGLALSAQVIVVKAEGFEVFRPGKGLPNDVQTCGAGLNERKGQEDNRAGGEQILDILSGVFHDESYIATVMPVLLEGL
jgi:hypothetical protein